MRWLNLFKKYDYASYSPTVHYRTPAAWQTAMREYSVGSESKHIDIGPDLHVDEPVIVSVCKNLFQSLTDMISSCEEPFTSFPKAQTDPDTGERVYNELCAGDRWLQLQV